jgi:hypothetical protein
MAQGSEKPSWAWSGGHKDCVGCGRTLRLADVVCWHSSGTVRVIFCSDCFPTRWQAWMREAGGRSILGGDG